MQIFDISQPLQPGIVVWPGDQPFVPLWNARIGRNSVVNVGAMSATLHLGSHADAPLHVDDQGTSIDSLDLVSYIGVCQVIEVYGKDAIHPSDFEQTKILRGSRVLFKTRPAPTEGWDAEMRYFAVETIHHLAALGVPLVGIDSASVDHPESKTLDAHHAIFAAGMVNLEGLALHAIEPGFYELVALPLRLVGMDASPVRAVLIRH